MATGERATWPPSTLSEVTAWTLADVAPGDLVFSSKAPRADKIEVLNEIAGQQWRHVGAVVNRDGGSYVVEIDKNSFGYRPLSDFMSAFDRYGVARLGLDPSCIDQASRWMQGKIAAGHVYAWDDLFLAGMLSLTARGIFVDHRERVRAALHAALEAAKAAQQSKATDSFTCSGFIQWAFEQAEGSCTIEHARWRAAVSWPPRLPSLDDVLSDEGIHLDADFADASLLELYELASVVDRSDDWRPNRDQWREGIRVLLVAASGYMQGAAPEHLHTDGRWVTPTDIWQSRSVSERGWLSKQTR